MNEQTRLPFDDLPEAPARPTGRPEPEPATPADGPRDEAGHAPTLELPFAQRSFDGLTDEPVAEAPIDATLRGVLRNRRFLALWLAQVASQIGGNMVLFAMTIMVADISKTNTSVSLLILTFLVPAVIFSAPAGVLVDRLDRRMVLITTNAARGVVFVLLAVLVLNVAATEAQLTIIYLFNIVVSTLTVFFAPAEASMIPVLVDRRQLLAANSLFTLTLQASFAIGFAVLGPLAISLSSVMALVVFVAVLYLVAAALCLVLPTSRPARVEAAGPGALGEAEQAMASMVGDMRDGVGYIRANRRIFWSLSYLAISASLIGILGVLGPGFARLVLGLTGEGLAVVLLPLGAGLVIGILVLNAYGRLLPRRRVIEGGLVALSIALFLLALAEPVSSFLKGTGGVGSLVSLLGIVVMLAMVAGVGYAFTAVPAQTQLQEELPEEVRGRVFGILNMLVNIASFLPIILVGPLADAIGPQAVLIATAMLVFAAGARSMVAAPPLVPATALPSHLEPSDPVTVTTSPRPRPSGRHDAVTVTLDDDPQVAEAGRQEGPG